MLRGEINEILVLPVYNAVSGPFLPTFQPSLHLRHYLQWRRYRGFRRFNEPGPPTLWGPHGVGDSTDLVHHNGSRRK